MPGAIAVTFARVAVRVRAVLAGVALVVLGLVLALAPARAAEDAREIEGRSLFARGDYQKALDLFSTLYAEKADPVYLRNIGRCHQMLRSADPAIDAFRAYLRRAPNLRPAERTEVQGFIGEMEALKQRQAGSVPPATPAPEAAAPAPAPAPAEILPARPPIGAPEPAANVLATTPTDPAPAAGPSIFGRWWFWTAVAGVVAAGTATAFILARGGSPAAPPCPDGAVCPR